ncbi:MAG: OmpA family protein [Bacteroidetes bacterium]|nr:OmpA family protein [Bacteroidota bacterium]
MSKLLPHLSGVACFLWVSGWTWIFSEGKNTAAAASGQPPPISIFIDSVRYDVQHPFAFEFSGATPIVAENLLPAIKSVARNLQKSASVMLTITGIYSPHEYNETPWPNLGLARAEAVKTMLTTSGAPPEKIQVKSLEASNFFKIDGKLVGVIYFSYSSQVVENQIVNEGKQDAVEAEEPTPAHTFFYKYGDFKVEKKNIAYLDSLRKLLRNNPENKVLLTGYSTPDEEAASTVRLAEIRALSVRRYLVDHGVRRVQIEVKAKPSMAQNSEQRIVSIQIIER